MLNLYLIAGEKKNYDRHALCNVPGLSHNNEFYTTVNCYMTQVPLDVQHVLFSTFFFFF